MITWGRKIFESKNMIKLAPSKNFIKINHQLNSITRTDVREFVKGEK
jgi:hypothetical protein